MAKYLFCIFCDSLDVSEKWNYTNNQYEYTCHECYEFWGDDESEYEETL